MPKVGPAAELLTTAALVFTAVPRCQLHSVMQSPAALHVLRGTLHLQPGSVRVPPAERCTVCAGVKTRLAALLADPSLKLPDIAAELARHTTTPSSVLETALSKMLAPSGAGLKAIRAGLSQALLVLLVAGEQDVTPLLARCGAGALKPEVQQLAAQLGRVAALNEAVHGQVLDLLSSGLV